MKNFKALGMSLLLATAGSAFAASNLSDDLDANDTPSILEERQNEVGNSVDTVDLNETPAAIEERERQEEVESDIIQGDDAEKTSDIYDEESDE